MDGNANAMDDQQNPQDPRPSLFPLFPAAGAAAASVTATTAATASGPEWLCNPSFTSDLSLINDAVSSLPRALNVEEEDEGEDEDGGGKQQQQQKNYHSYELLEEEEDDEEDSDSDGEKYDERQKNKKKSKKRNKKRRMLKELGDSKSIHAKDYYFDSHPDHDNLAYGSLYRMDVPRYKLYSPQQLSAFLSQGLYRWTQRASTFDKDADIDALDTKLKSAGRYWSPNNAALERHNNLKRLRLFAPKNSSHFVPADFIPLSDSQSSDQLDDESSISNNSIIEESWEDEVLRKTREFNKLTREHPHDEKAWLAFAEFQDKVASMQRQKGVRLQTLEKKISILEKATELNPDNEQLLLCLMKAYQKRDNTDVLVGRWQSILRQHSGSYVLWKEFLHVVQGEFSRFKVSDMRKMYAHAIQALSATFSKQFRQIHQTSKRPDSAMVHLELGLVDIFLSLCRFEWQTGHQELATALFQAEIEFSLFCPSLFLNEHGKQRLFKHFWDSDDARVGEEGALGWSMWLEKEEENRQRVMKEEGLDKNDEGGWTGWSEPLSKSKKTSTNIENIANNDVTAEEFDEEIENEDIKQEDDTEALLKQLGIDVDAGASAEVKDTLTWARWSEEESARDSDQWMPVRAKPGAVTSIHGTPNEEVDGQLMREILYEDVSEYLFSLSSAEARLSLVFQFIDFYGGKISSWVCTNSSSWTEKILGLEELPGCIGENMRRMHDDLTKLQNKSGQFGLEFLWDSARGIPQRTEMMKFLRNAALLCLTAFPRNHILEEATLLAEELFVTKMNSSSCSVTPCQALAKHLLKCDRQDLLLCGIYARREAVYGNMDHARRVFDMALLSLPGLPLDLQANSPLLYLWYAEAELGHNHGYNFESSSRAMHILSCLGSGVTYSPFKGHPSSLQLLRARQGYKEKISALRSKWMRGFVDDQSVALVCAAALFEELTAGWAAGIEIIDGVFTLVLPERRSQSYHLECLFNYYIRMLQRHHGQFTLSKAWESVTHGLKIYPSSPELFNALVEISCLYTTPNKLRRMFDDYCHKKPSVIVWLFALIFEMSRRGSMHRIHGLFERALANDQLHNSVILWRWYISYEINIMRNPSAARRTFFRAIHACPWSKKLWLDGFLKLDSILTAKELSDLQEVMRDKELNLRTDIYEILLQDELG
ncbi:protein NRDE2 homolog isoform X2 [Herrania umbratica]|uniref:Protein NRDE2 homolog isoform X2 n=1 Tax=Herrania umbratica TaxID=108875 RepID=A0A6J1AXQ3_9ROSI|nr:protein NRDE2 homolog isoform X2 [Herrania umbratica]